ARDVPNQSSLWSVVTVTNGRLTGVEPGLNVGFEAEHPHPELIVETELAASDDSVHALGMRDRGDAGQGRVELRLAPAIADVGAQVDAGPTVDGNGRSLIRRVDRQVRRSRRATNERQRNSCQQKFLHDLPLYESVPRRGNYICRSVPYVSSAPHTKSIVAQ